MNTMLAKNSIEPFHWARCSAQALLNGRAIRLDCAIGDFKACGAFECARLVEAFQLDLVFESYGVAPGALRSDDCRRLLRARLFRFKLARRWAEFVEGSR